MPRFSRRDLLARLLKSCFCCSRQCCSVESDEESEDEAETAAETPAAAEAVEAVISDEEEEEEEEDEEVAEAIQYLLRVEEPPSVAAEHSSPVFKERIENLQQLDPAKVSRSDDIGGTELIPNDAASQLDNIEMLHLEVHSMDELKTTEIDDLCERMDHLNIHGSEKTSREKLRKRSAAAPQQQRPRVDETRPGLVEVSDASTEQRVNDMGEDSMSANSSFKSCVSTDRFYTAVTSVSTSSQYESCRSHTSDESTRVHEAEAREHESSARSSQHGGASSAASSRPRSASTSTQSSSSIVVPMIENWVSPVQAND